jgi:hypothetical protein
MDERENRRKAKEREQQSSGATDRYTQVEYTCSFAVVLWPLNSQLTFSVAQGGKLRRKYTRKAQAASAGKPHKLFSSFVCLALDSPRQLLYSAGGAGAGGATTTSEAVLKAQQTRSSKKINYDALKVSEHAVAVACC